MNIIYDASFPPSVFIDTTVLCGALRKDGINRRILKAARFPRLFRPVLSKVCLWEFVRHASLGLGGVRYNESEINDFYENFLFPIFSYYNTLPVNSLIGRYSVKTILREHRPIGEVLVELSGCDIEIAKEIMSTQEMSQPLSDFDQNDFHVWLSAIREECQYILTSNENRFPQKIGIIERIHPKDFYQALENA